MKKTILTLASACALATSAYAGPTYNEIIGEWVHPDWNGGGSGDGAGLSLSYSPAEHFYLAASGQWVDMGIWDDFSQYTASVGGYFALIPDKLHVAGDIGGVWRDMGVFGDDSGLYINPHLRWTPHQKIEVRVGGIFTDLDDNEDWAYYGRLFFNVFEAVDITVSYTGNDDYDAFTAGVRFRF